MTRAFQRALSIYSRANWKHSEFFPLTTVKLPDKAWADGTAASLAGKPATVEAAATDDKNGCAICPLTLVLTSSGT